jgi:hypothetical protein
MMASQRHNCHFTHPIGGCTSDPDKDRDITKTPPILEIPETVERQSVFHCMALGMAGGPVVQFLIKCHRQEVCSEVSRSGNERLHWNIILESMWQKRPMIFLESGHTLKGGGLVEM